MSHSHSIPSAPATGCEKWKPSRRDVLGAGGAIIVGGGLAAGLSIAQRNEGGMRANVFIGKADAYDPRLVNLISDGLSHIGVTRDEIRGKSVLLKPNLVETALDKPHINTHPVMLVAAAEAFRRLDASRVIIAEGQGHRRDTELVLQESGVSRALEEGNLPFVDLNHDEVAPRTNAGEWTKLTALHLPRTLLEADVIVSMPKMKTHHWAGMTCAMKNLFGVMPGVVYGWPKNLLHYQGIPQSILDINATVAPHLTIVDGIIGMEGDGPIMGGAKRANCVLVGRNFPAVDATAARIMNLNVGGIPYLAAASGKLGPVQSQNITQVGEPIAAVQNDFAVLDVPHLRGVKA